MAAAEDEQPATASCGYCLGAGELYRVPARPDGPPASSCTSCSPSADDWEAFPCPRCAGSGLVSAAGPTRAG